MTRKVEKEIPLETIKQKLTELIGEMCIDDAARKILSEKSIDPVDAIGHYTINYNTEGGEFIFTYVLKGQTQF